MKENVSFYELEKEVYRLVCQLGCSILKLILENYDKQLMNNRDTKEYRHKGLRGTTIKTVMGEVEYDRVMYLKDKKTVYLLDDILKIATCKRVSANFVETALKTVVNTTSYRKAEKALQDTTNARLSHQELNQLVWLVGAKIESKENEEIKLHREEKLAKGTKQIKALFEEADGLWFNLQGEDRKIAKEKYIKECEKQNKECKENHKLKTELKLHIMYEGWSTNNRHSLINKAYISGVMTPERLRKLKSARIHQKYDTQKIELRASNGDGAKWINKIMSKDTITQKDLFHIEQEIVRSIKIKKYRDELMQIIADKRYNEVQNYIENLKYELGGEEKVVNQLKTLQSYLSEGLPRYQDILKEQGKELPKAPERNRISYNGNYGKSDFHSLRGATM